MLLATRQTVHSQSSRRKRKRCRRWNLCTGPSLLKLKAASPCLWTKNPTAGPPVTKPYVIQPSTSTQPHLPLCSLCVDPTTPLGAAPWRGAALWSPGWQALCPRQAHRRPRSRPPRRPQTFLLQPQDMKLIKNRSKPWVAHNQPTETSLYMYICPTLLVTVVRQIRTLLPYPEAGKAGERHCTLPGESEKAPWRR